MSRKILVIGGGIAGLSAAEAAKKQDPDSEVIVYSAESDLPYYRLRVAEVLHNPEQKDQLFLHDEAWFEEKGIDIKLAETLKEIKPDEKQVVFESGSVADYDKLILAMGSRSRKPNMPGCRRPGVFTLWTLADARRFSEAIAEKDLKSCAIVGGGVLGLEAASQLLQRGVKVSILEYNSHLMQRQLNSKASKAVEDHIKAQGVTLYTEADTAEILGEGEDGSVTALKLKDGREVPCDAVLFSIGVLANTRVAEDAGLAIGRRIKVNPQMQSSKEDIYAAGDVAEIDPDGFWFGLWTISRKQGKVAGSNAAGADEKFVKVIPPYLVNTLGTKIVSQGEFPSTDKEGVHVEQVCGEPGDPHSYKATYYRDGKLIGFMLVGTPAKKEMVSLQEELKAANQED